MAKQPEHECVYAKTIGIDPVMITDESGIDRCQYCHVEWAPKPTRVTGGK